MVSGEVTKVLTPELAMLWAVMVRMYYCETVKPGAPRSWLRDTRSPGICWKPLYRRHNLRRGECAASWCSADPALPLARRQVDAGVRFRLP